MRLVISIFVVLFASQGFAQVIYEPVQYQHGERHSFYYGGSDASVLAFANRQSCRNVGSEDPPSVYSDCYPYWNARIFDVTANDASNEAYANVPRNFRKGDLLRSARPEADGSLMVPANAPMIGAPAVAAPRTPKGYIIIIPKKLLQPRVAPSDKRMAVAG